MPMHNILAPWNETSRYLTRWAGMAVRLRGASSFVVNTEFEVRLAVFCVT